ncbi:RHS repeat domain-containing protein [Flavobacterium oreochromis]|uniref:RHS repeat domain-containing protein n=1 Tax=Flavobacterium oreochromis TaxID=2906078 RepID=UPI0028698CC7|nr:RHS repeat-associated core domain-containing protein [Flavobacterium oreochromis]
MYGKITKFTGDRSFIPFRQLGQYEDPELDGLYYNRFRYYDASTGLYISQDPIGLHGNNPTMYGYTFDSNTQIDIFGLAGVPWLPHGATQPDIVSKGPHFYAGDGKTELKLALDGDRVTFIEAFGKDANTPALKKAIKESEEKLLNDKSWREKLLKNAREVKISLFENFGRLDRARDVKKLRKR